MLKVIALLVQVFFVYILSVVANVLLHLYRLTKSLFFFTSSSFSFPFCFWQFPSSFKGKSSKI